MTELEITEVLGEVTKIFNASASIPEEVKVSALGRFSDVLQHLNAHDLAFRAEIDMLKLRTKKLEAKRMEETNKEPQEVDYFDVAEPSTVTIEFSLNVKKVIVGWILGMVTYFAWSLAASNWNTLLLQAAIIVGAGVAVLVVYENASGNKFDLPTIEWKNLSKTIATLIIATVALIVGAIALIQAVLWLFLLFPWYEIQVALMTFLVIVGSVLLYLGYRSLKGLLKVQHRGIASEAEAGSAV